MATSDAVWVPNFGYKGEGKRGNYGVVIQPPQLVSPDSVPKDPQQAASSSSHGGGAPPDPPLIPTAIAASTEQVEEWVQASFRPLRNLSGKSPPEIGDNVLWRGVKVGKHGYPSTVVEYFNGKVQHLEVSTEDGELYFYVD